MMSLLLHVGHVCSVRSFMYLGGVVPVGWHIVTDILMDCSVSAFRVKWSEAA
jgi:hypothetical protein